MTEPIFVVEPTLEDDAGHCRSFIGAVAGAGPDQRFEVYGSRRVGDLFPDLPQVRLHAHFTRRLRRPQALLLYRQLLRREGKIFVPTAGRTDLELINLAARGHVPEAKASFFFHWIRLDGRKRRHFERLAARQPALRVLGATDEIVAILREVGFANAKRVPYPVTVLARPPAGPPTFHHLLFAGAARRDKGFAHVVDLVARLAECGEELPVAVQTSARHYGKRDAAIAADAARLDAIGYRGLRVHPDTLDAEGYLALFHGAICLQPYDRAEFAGRVSAVTVDALASGAPVITTSGTWMGRTVEQRGAGLALDDLSAASLHAAVQRLVADYDRYSENARKAADAVQREHSGAHLLAAVLA